MRLQSLLIPLAALPCVAQTPFQASLVALQPIVVSGNGGAPVSHPAGPLTSVSLAGPVGTTHANFSCSLVNSATACTFTASSSANAWWPIQSQTSADLLLQVSPAVPGTVAWAEITLGHGGDSPDPTGFAIDIGNDGSVELSTAFPNPGDRLRRQYTFDFSGGPLVLRIHHLNDPYVAVQGFSVGVHLEPSWQSATPGAVECPTQVRVPLGIGPPLALAGIYTNYHLIALPAPAPNMAELRAIGYGSFSAFAVADQPAQFGLTLPSPYTPPCNVLAGVQVTLAGSVMPPPPNAPTPQPIGWSLMVPLLPPGLVFHVQHLSASLGAPFSFGASNVLRIDT